LLSAGAFADVVADAANRFAIPGIAAAVVRGGEMHQTARGVLNVATGVEATPDSVFQIGSITKVFTGTLVMQLVDAGKIELDAPVRTYLPTLRIAEAPISNAITVRTLLTHTSGIVGDFFVDTGANDDATERYVERCSELAYFTEPGIYSYCNSGFGILGRLIEVVGGAPWVAQLRAKILDPLRMAALVDPEETMFYRAAAGHILTASGEIRLTPTPFLPRSTESIGARLTMSPATMLAFAQCHLRDGLAADGTRLLSERSARAMRESNVRLPFDFLNIEAFGLAWAIRDAEAGVVGHNGGTIGQSAFLLLFPEVELALAVLTNISSSATSTAFEEIVRAVVASVDGARLRVRPPIDPNVIVATTALVGTYQTAMNRIAIVARDGLLHATVVRRSEYGLAPLDDEQYVLEALDELCFEAVDARDGARNVAGFTSLHNGIPRFLFWGGRLAERIEA
jgi:CubicO group peptidase (beta-lactamase class C family)